MDFEVKTEEELSLFGTRLGLSLKGGEILQLSGDVGAGKTTLTKYIARGMGIKDTINSPSYTLNLQYKAPSGLFLTHYDFYRLDNPGIMANELRETIDDPGVVTIIEWGNIVEGVLPNDSLRIMITPTGETSRRLSVIAGGDSSSRIVKELHDLTA